MGDTVRRILFYWDGIKQRGNKGVDLESAASLHAIERVVLLLLVMVAAFAVMAHRLKVPYPIVLVLAGLVLSFVPHMPRIPLNPNLVFVIFLPPLLYAAAWAVSWRDFRRNLRHYRIAGSGAGRLYRMGGSRVFRPLYYSAGLEVRFSAGSGAVHDGCDRGDFGGEVARPAAADRGHSGGRKPAERCDRSARARDRSGTSGAGGPSHAGSRCWRA